MQIAAPSTRDPEWRAAQLARLCDYRRHHGSVPTGVVERVAAAFDVTPRTVYRWLRHGAGPRPASRTALSERMLELYFDHYGHVPRVAQALRAEDANAPSERTLYRLFARELSAAERAMAREGVAGRRRHTVYLRWEASHRNQIWEADLWEAPLWVAPSRGARPVKPWVTTILDARTRALMAAVATEKRPTQGTVLAALQHAIRRNSEEEPFYGRPELVRWDHGGEFVADAITQVALALGFTAKPVSAYAPHLKGKVERVQRTFEQELVSRLPNYLQSPRRADGRRFDRSQPLISFHGFRAEVAAYVAAYNTERPHSALGGGTPLECWNADPTPLRAVVGTELRWLLPRHSAKVTTSGVRHEKRWYFAVELNGLVGETVELAYMPGEAGRVEVYHHGAWLATAVPATALSAEERTAAIVARRRDERRAELLARAAGRRQKARYDEANEPSRAAASAGDRAAPRRGRRQLQTALLGIGAGLEALAEESS